MVRKKFELVKDIVAQNAVQHKSLLDVGCRDCALNEYVRDMVSYSGVDLFQNERGTVEFVTDIANGLPVDDASYDVVVALDVLEHLDDVHTGIADLLRVARKTVIINLPNMAFVMQRFNFFLRGRFNTKKYDLVYNPREKNRDRHRWLTVQPQTDVYMQDLARDNSYGLEIIRVFESRKRKFFAVCCRLIGLPPSWWVPSSLYVLNKK